MMVFKKHCALIVLAVAFAHAASAQSSFGKSAFGTSGSSFNRERGTAPAIQSDTKSIAPAAPKASVPDTQVEAPDVAIQVPPQSAPRPVAAPAPVQSPTATAVTAAVVTTLDVVASGYSKSSDGKRISPPAGVTPAQLKSAQGQAKTYQREVANYRPPAVGSSD